MITPTKRISLSALQDVYAMSTPKDEDSFVLLHYEKIRALMYKEAANHTASVSYSISDIQPIQMPWVEIILDYLMTDGLTASYSIVDSSVIFLIEIPARSE